MIRVLHVKPNEEPKEVFIEDSLEGMQKLIGDDDPMLDRLSLTDDRAVGMYFDDDGIRKKLAPNRWYEHHMIFGPFFISRLENSKSTNLTDVDVSRWTKKFALSQSRLF